MALFLKHFPFLFFEVPSLCIPQFGCRETTLRSKTKKKNSKFEIQNFPSFGPDVKIYSIEDKPTTSIRWKWVIHLWKSDYANLTKATVNIIRIKTFHFLSFSFNFLSNQTDCTSLKFPSKPKEKFRQQIYYM